MNEPAQPAQPAHPLHQLTTSELTGYRRELEHSLKHLPGHAEVRKLLARKLKDVLGEQESRQQIARANGA